MTSPLLALDDVLASLRALVSAAEAENARLRAEVARLRAAQDEGPPRCSVAEAVERIGVCEDVVRRLMREGRIGSVRVGRRYRLSREDVERVAREGAT